MKKPINHLIIILLIFTLPSCFYQIILETPQEMKKNKRKSFVTAETKDGRLIKNEKAFSVMPSDSGLSVTDSAGKQFINYKELRSLTVKKPNYLANLLITATAVTLVASALYIYLYSQIAVNSSD